MSCLPGMPCYDAFYHPSENCGCNDCCTDSDHVTYVGPNLPNSGIRNKDTLTTALEKIDAKLDPNDLAAAILQAINNSPTLKTTLCNIISTCP